MKRLLSFGVLFLALCSFSRFAGATAFSVTGTGDAGACVGTVCPSLRAAFTSANGGGAASHTITFGAAVTGTINLTGGTLPTPVAGHNITINAPTLPITINGNGNRILNLGAATTFVMNNLNLTGGGGNGGGAILASAGTVNINNSTLYNNPGAGNGGAIRNNGAAITIRNSTFNGNTANGNGGAIQNDAGTLVLNNDTIINNDATGAIAVGGGVNQTGGTVTVSNTIIANNLNNGSGLFGVLAPDCAGNITSADYNLIGNTVGCNVTGATANNITAVTAVFGALQNNGGTTLTNALLAGSPAINEANPTLGAPPLCETTDQRGNARTAGQCDIGAFEAGTTDVAGRLELSSATYFVNENGAGFITITVNRIGGSQGTVTAAFTTADGTATAGIDYTAISGTLTWNNGVTGAQTFNVNITNDVVPDGTNSFFVSFDNITGGATIGGPNESEVFIIDNDFADLNLQSGTLAFGPTDVGSLDGPNTITLVNSGNSAVNIGQADIIGDDLTAFEISNDTCSGATVAAAGTCSFDLTFFPDVVNPAYSAQVRFPSDDPNSPLLIAVTGDGTANALAITTPVDGSTIDFGNVTVTIPATQTPAELVELRNTGTTDLTVTSATLSGSADFSTLSNTCLAGLVLQPGSTCLVQVVFAPSTAVLSNGTLDFITDGGNSSIDLQGTGVVAPNAVADPADVDFGTIAVGSSSGPLAVLLSNNGTTDLTVTANPVSSDPALFTIQNSANACSSGTVLTPGSSCVVQVVYNADDTSADTETLTFATDGGSPVVNLTGNGALGPDVTLSSTSLTFGNTGVGNSSDPQLVQVTNNGTTTLNIVDVTLTNDVNFHIIGNTCDGQAIPVNGSCVFQVIFSPTTDLPAPLTDTVSVASDAASTPDQVSLSGTGVFGPVASLSASSLSFGTIGVGNSSQPQLVQVTNNGTTPLNIVDVTLVTDVNFHIIGNTCDGQAIPVNGSCVFQVIFSPTTDTPDPLTDTVNIASDASTSPDQVALDGTGAFGPVVSLSATSLSFGSVGVGNSSDPQLVQVTNTGTTPLNINSVSLTDDTNYDLIGNTCDGQSIAVNGSCVFQVIFRPTTDTPDPLTDTVEIDSDAVTTPDEVALDGTGEFGPVISLSTTSLSFATTGVGNSSQPQLVQVTNKGTTPLSIVDVTLASNVDYKIIGNTCDGQAIPVNGSCVFQVIFSPTTDTPDPLTDTINIDSDAVSGPEQVSVSGTGAFGPVASLSATSLSFGSIGVGNSSDPKLVQVTNNGTTPLNIVAVSLADDTNYDILGNTCDGQSIAVHGSCVVQVVFRPTTDTPDPLTDTLEFDSDDPSSPSLVSLSGTGTFGPAVSIIPDPMTFPDDQPVGTTSPARLIVIRSVGITPVENVAISSFDDGTNFRILQDACTGIDLPVGSSCSVLVNFTPTTTGALSDFFTVTADNGVSEQADVNGNAIQTAISVTGSGAFGNGVIGSISGTHTITVTNIGNDVLTLGTIVQTGTNTEQFIISDNNCDSQVLNPTESCTFDVSFFPVIGGALNSNILIPNNSATPSINVGLTGTGILQSIGRLQIKTNTLDFDVEVGTTLSQATTVTNIGNGDVTIGTLTLDGDSNFTQTNTCDGVTLGVGDTCAITATFVAGNSAGNFKATVSIDSTPQTNDFLSLTGSALLDDDTTGGGGCSIGAAAGVSSSALLWIVLPVSGLFFARIRRRD